ncbi:hypothetical protein OG730_07825 [Streptomyces sp. NBC_01298]|uniref:hypothetical protein n=1 Tax=Streptomyces sp. NBC_01298 TaxID=2903817 RepID=UPI002E0F1463|nr:hypothetical protein OG730_07825 [Streptomyces sp. NBC_01298]
MLTRLTDRDERALLAAAENRIADPLRLGPALAAVRRLLWRERESVTCHPTAAAHRISTDTSTSASTSTSSDTSTKRRQPAAPLPR